jgi:hypothetical protein
VPPALVAEIVNTCDPRASPDAVQALAQAEAEPPSKLQVTVADGSSTENDTMAAVDAVDKAGPEITVTVGAGVAPVRVQL